MRAPPSSLLWRRDRSAVPRADCHRHQRVRCRSRTGSRLSALYEPIVVGRPAFISFQTAAELRYGAMLRGWGESRLHKLEARIGAAETVHSGPELVSAYVTLRIACARAGHALSQREHDADRWIAATALRLGVPLVSNDGIFLGVPGLVLETALGP